MKKHTYVQGFVGIFILVLGLFPAVTFAESVGSAVTIQATTGLRADDGDNVDSSLRSSTTINAQLPDRGDYIADGAHEVTTTKHHQEVDHESSASMESDEGDNDIEIDQESADHASSTIDTPDHVSNRGQLRSFLNHLVKKDDHIADVHVSSTTIETHYEMPAKFLWVIPTNINAHVVINADGSVTVTYPWYAFLFAKNGEIENTLTQTVSSSAGATTSLTLSASAQAHLSNLLFLALKDSKN